MTLAENERDNKWKCLKRSIYAGFHFSAHCNWHRKSSTASKKNGLLELIVDKKRNITDALVKWAKNQGYKISDIEDDPRMVRLFIHKSSRGIKV